MPALASLLFSVVRSGSRLGGWPSTAELQAEKGNDACPHKKMYRAADMERQVWEFVSSLLTNSDQLRADLEMIEEELKGIHSGPEPEQGSKTWLNKLAQVERKRSRFQDMAS